MQDEEDEGPIIGGFEGVNLEHELTKDKDKKLYSKSTVIGIDKVEDADLVTQAFELKDSQKKSEDDILKYKSTSSKNYLTT